MKKGGIGMRKHYDSMVTNDKREHWYERLYDSMIHDDYSMGR